MSDLTENTASARAEAKKLLSHPPTKDTNEALLAELSMGRIWRQVA